MTFRVADVLALLLFLFPLAFSLVVEDRDSDIKYRGSWKVAESSGSTAFSGGTEHQTDTPGDTLSYSFKGYTSVAVYGSQTDDGAIFSFSAGGQTKNCTCANTSGGSYNHLLCSIGGLRSSSSYTLAIKHIDAADRWLHIDNLHLDATSTTTSSQRSTYTSTDDARTSSVGGVGVPLNSGTITKSGMIPSHTSHASAPHTTSHKKKKHSGAAIAGLVAGIISFVGVCAGAVARFIRRQRNRLIGREDATPNYNELDDNHNKPHSTEGERALYRPPHDASDSQDGDEVRTVSSLPYGPIASGPIDRDDAVAASRDKLLAHPAD